MKFQNLPPLNSTMLDHFRSQARILKAPGGLVAFHVDKVLTTAAVAIAGDVCRVLSWSSNGPMTPEQAQAEIDQQVSAPSRAVSIN